jgi:hypothetical protein
VARWSTHLPSSRLFLFFSASHLLKTTSSLKDSRRARGEGLPPGGGDSFSVGQGAEDVSIPPEEPTRSLR